MMINFWILKCKVENSPIHFVEINGLKEILQIHFRRIVYILILILDEALLFLFSENIFF
jgi:hypothetical protein